MSEKTPSAREDFGRRGNEIYDRDILPRLCPMGPEDYWKVIAIEVETGDYEIDKNEIVACDRLRERHPTAVFWLRRLGTPHLRQFGFRIKYGRMNLSAQ
jgi:hypothetical protein